jgi:sulfate transport system substrate-binding protein
MLATLLGVVACGSSSDKSSSDTSGSASSPNSGQTIDIVGYSVAEAAHKVASADFQKTDEGKGVTFQTSYGASGDQSRAVESGLAADLVHFSIESDVTRLVKSGQVADTWNTGPTKGIISSSVVVFAVRKGNPKNIHTWADLVKPGVSIITPNPGSSGAARWNALAAYGQVLDGGGSEGDAVAYLDQFFANVVALPGSGRDATTAFTGGTGDVLMTYENEAILARQKGEDFDYVIPDTTLLIENPAAVTTEATPAATAYLDYILTADGQKAFASEGYRPVISGVDVDNVEGAIDPSDPFPTVPHLLTIQKDFTSWSDVTKKFFDEDNGIVIAAIAKSGKA